MALSSAEVDICRQSLGKIGAKRFTYGDTTSNQSVECLLHYAQTRDALLRSFEWPFAKKRLRLVTAWATLDVETTDMYVWQSSLLYKCAVAHTAGTFATDNTAGKWSLQSTVSAWATLTAYTIGLFVVNNSIYYKCIKAHTAGDTDDEPGVGATTATYWEVINEKPTNDFGYSYALPATSLRLVEFVDSDNIEWHLETNTILTDETGVDIVYVDQITTTTEWSSLFTEMMICSLALKLIGPLTGMGSGSVNAKELLLKEYNILKKQTRTIARQEGRNKSSSDWNRARITHTLPL